MSENYDRLCSWLYLSFEKVIVRRVLFYFFFQSMNGQPAVDIIQVTDLCLQLFMRSLDNNILMVVFLSE